jgi:hypothetical protein
VRESGDPIVHYRIERAADALEEVRAMAAMGH